MSQGSSSAREAILSRIGAALGGDRTATPDSVSARLAAKAIATRPRVNADASGDLTEQLIARMESVQMSVVRLQTTREIVGAVDWYLQSEGLPSTVTVAPDLGHLDWPRGYRQGIARGDEEASVTPCLAAVAETGSVALASSGQTPATLNFLPETHIIVVYESQVVSHLEDVWTRMRKLGVLPRALNFVTGPSRTADIEQTIEIGAHGPRRTHVLLVAGD